jgi:ribosomal protein S15P/S13E
MAFSGNTQNANAFNVNMIDEKESLHTELRDLEQQKKNLTERINAHARQGPQDEESMAERDQVQEKIDNLKAYMKKRGLEGGRRKKHRRTKRHSKSRRSKSRRSKH